jgi:hypothetical protein
VGQQAWLAGCTSWRRITRVNRDARASASRFTEPNSQDSPSLAKRTAVHCYHGSEP